MKREDFLKHLEDGPYAWPGGYPRYFVMADGGTISFKGAEQHKEDILEALDTKDRSTFYVDACDVNWESELYCDVTGEPIESAYGAEDDNA